MDLLVGHSLFIKQSYGADRALALQNTTWK